MIRFFAVFITILLFSSSVSAQSMKGQYKQWALFTTMEGKNKVCYITSSPTKKSGTYKKRGDVYILVTYRGKESNPEVSVDGGFSYKDGSEVDFVIDNKKSYKFFTSNETPEMAWAQDEQVDKDVIEAMKNGKKIVAKATSTKNTNSEDTYSLSGFTAAYKKMMENCK